MNSMELIGLNTKYYRYKLKITQEQLSDISNFKIAYISLIESGRANMTCNNIDHIAKVLGIEPADLFNKETARKAKSLPPRVDMI